MHWKRLLIARATRLVAIVRKHFVNTMTSNSFILIHPLRMHRRLAEAKNRPPQHNCPRRRKMLFILRTVRPVGVDFGPTEPARVIPEIQELVGKTSNGRLLAGDT